jgi:hypothetical protein
MVSKGVIVVLLLSIAFAGVVSAEEDIFFSGDVSFDIQPTYSAGSSLDTSFRITNSEPFSLADASLIVEIIQGCIEPIYPSQMSDCDNVVYEQVISDINLVPNSVKDVNFSYVLPNDLSSGIYRVEAFLRTQRTPIVGMAQIFIPGKSKSFSLTGSGNFPFAKIMRTKTEVNGQPGPIGVGVNLVDSPTMNLFVSSNKTASVRIKITTCDWQDSICPNPMFVQESTSSLIVGENKIPITLKVPQSPGAYALRLEVIEGERLVSLYRSRMVVMGATARVRQLYTDKHFYSDEDLNVTVLVGGSPDHYTYPTINNANLEVTIKSLNDGEIYSDSVVIPELSKDNFFVKKSFILGVKGEMSKFEVCAKLTSSDLVVYDNYCYVVDSTRFDQSNKHLLELNEEYTDEGFVGQITVGDVYTKLPIKTDLFVVVKKGGEYLSSETYDDVSATNISFEISAGEDYTVLIQDKRTLQEVSFKVGKASLFGSVVIYTLIVLAIILLVWGLIRWRKKDGQ